MELKKEAIPISKAGAVSQVATNSSPVSIPFIQNFRLFVSENRFLDFIRLFDFVKIASFLEYTSYSLHYT